jgi:hypothetical protein
MERGETDVGHFLFAKNEALIGRLVVRLRNIRRGYGRCGGAAQQRKTQPGGSERLRGGGLNYAFRLRCLLDPWHSRISRVLLEKRFVKRALRQSGALGFCRRMPNILASSC